MLLDASIFCSLHFILKDSRLWEQLIKFCIYFVGWLLGNSQWFKSPLRWSSWQESSKKPNIPFRSSDSVYSRRFDKPTSFFFKVKRLQLFCLYSAKYVSQLLRLLQIAHVSASFPFTQWIFALSRLRTLKYTIHIGINVPLFRYKTHKR